MTATKFILLVGDHENGVIGREEEELLIRDIGLNFDHSPSIAALYEVYSDMVKDIALDLRSQGIKVGVYATREKAQRFFWKSIGREDLGSTISFDTMNTIPD